MGNGTQTNGGGKSPGNGSSISVDLFLKNIKYFAFLLIPLLIWIVRVEGFVGKGDRQTSAMALEQHTVMMGMISDDLQNVVPSQLYTDYIDDKFERLNERLDHIELILVSGCP